MGYCNECGKTIRIEGSCFTYEGNPICSDCAVTNENGAICPLCGRKVPHEYMNSDICQECDEQVNKH